MNFDPDKRSETLNAELNEENENLNAENTALMESITSVYYQSYVARKERENEREHVKEIENELIGERRENRRLLESNKKLCGSLKEERKRNEDQESKISALTAKGRTLTIVVITMSLLLALTVFASVVFMEQGNGSKAIVMNLREASHSRAEMAEMIPDEVRYTYEDTFHEQW